jgi:3-hydroxyisobutyrate dehydrogenase-like beta-hydroxyacid dehydrogenase
MSAVPFVDAYHHIWRLNVVPWCSLGRWRTPPGSPAYSSVMDTKGQKVLRGDFSPESRVAQTLKDARVMLDQAARAGQRLPLTEVNAALLQAVIDLHRPDVDPAAVIAAIRAKACV